MPDYYSLLVQKIREAETDSKKLRELVCEAARLALRRHVNVHYPTLSLQEGKRLLDELEAAIERLEADAEGTLYRPAAVRDGSCAQDRGDASSAVRPRLPQDGANLLDWPLAELHNEPELCDLVPNQLGPTSRDAADLPSQNLYLSRRNESYEDPAKPRNGSNRRIVIGIGITTYIGVAILAGAALYVAMSARAPPHSIRDLSASILPPKSPPTARSGTNPDRVAAPLTAASFAPAATTTVASATIASPRTFPFPTAYGVYAVSNDRLIELERISANPVDRRTNNRFRIIKPSRTVINDAKLSFVAYHHDLTAIEPDKASVRIAARIARAMTIDPLGKAVMEPPPTEAWLIRELGYNLRLSRMSEHPEMVMMQPENQEFAFSPGRYVLVLSGQFYDFVIAGIITDPTQCVEGVTTARGLAYYECRTP
jgi:hypothetical protein